MVQNEEKEKNNYKKIEDPTENNCPICEGQGCECAQKEEKKDFDNEAEQNMENDEPKNDDKLNEEIENLKEEKIRLLAEMENLRKRFEREKVDTIKFGSINLARDILTLGDNLERALSALPEKDEYSQNIKNLVDGLKMVLKDFKSILEKHGVKKIESLDKKFDHNYHQAMMEIERDNVDEGTVVQEVQSGYTMHDRLLRAAMVGVSKKPSTNKDKAEDEEKLNKGEN